MKRFIAVLSGLLVLPAFAEVAPVYYDEVVEYTDDMIDSVDDEVETEVVQQVAPQASKRTTINRSTSISRASPVSGTGVTSRANVSSRAVASSPRTTTSSRATASRAARTASVVNRPSTTTSRTTVTPRGAATTKPVTARVGTSNNTVISTGRGVSYSSQQTLNDSGNALYNPNTVSRVGVANRRTVSRISATGLPSNTSTTPVITQDDVSETTTNLTALTELTDYCKAQYAACMDNYCNVLDDNQGRCSCSKNIKNYAATEKALNTASEEFQDIIQKISYIGLTKDQIIALYEETAAEKQIESSSKTRTAFEQQLDKIRNKDLINASSPKASSYNNDVSINSSGIFDFDTSAGIDWTSWMSNPSSNSSVSNQRGEQLYKTAAQRCKATVLNSCTDQGIDANVITNSYDLEIDKQCIAYERSLNEANDEMRTNARNAATILQRARLKLAQMKNSYDLRGCVAALDSCMQDEYVCGDDYKLCLDATGKYINEGKLIAGSMPGIAGGTPINQNPMSSSDWTSKGMYDLYAAWNYESDGQKNAWGAGDSENISNFIETRVSKWTPTTRSTTSEDMATYLLKKIGYIDGDDKENGMCASVFKQCQDYTYNNKKYVYDNPVVRQYLASALTKIKLQQDTILSEHAEGCKSDVTSCLSTNGYDNEKSSTSTVNTQAIRACASQIATCMSVTGYKPNDPTKITYKVMSDWTSSVITDRDDESQYEDAYYETASGAYALCEKGYACNGKTRTACSGLTYSDTYGASECKACPTPSAYSNYLASSANSVWYASQTTHDSESLCYAKFENIAVENGASVTVTCQAYNGDYGTAPEGSLLSTGSYSGTARCSVRDVQCNDGYHFNVHHFNRTAGDNSYEASLLCNGKSGFEGAATNGGSNISTQNINLLKTQICVSDTDQTFKYARKYIANGKGLTSESDIQNWCEKSVENGGGGTSYVAPGESVLYENL